MANAFGTLSTAVVVQEALDLVFAMFPALTAISMDLSDQAVDFNQQVISRKLTVPAVSAFGSAAADITTTDVPVTINTHSQIRHTIPVATYSGTKRNLIAEQAQPLAIAIGSAMTAAASANWTNVNYGGGSAQETAATTFPTASVLNYNAMTVLRAVLNGRGVPQMNRFAVVDSTRFSQLLQDPAIAYSYANPTDGKVIRQGVLTSVAGFDVYEYPGLLSTGVSAGSKLGVAGTKDSVVYAARVQKDPRDILQGAPFPGAYGVITNETSGLSVLLSEWIDPITMDANIRLSWMYGTAVGNSANLQLIRT